LNFFQDVLNFPPDPKFRKLDFLGLFGTFWDFLGLFGVGGYSEYYNINIVHIANTILYRKYRFL
jgi:hypothetical protein